MVESFENSDNISRNGADDKVKKKILSRNWTGSRSRKKKEKPVSEIYKSNKQNMYEINIFIHEVKRSLTR